MYSYFKQKQNKKQKNDEFYKVYVLRKNIYYFI